jgi:hypothetical protein
MIILQVMLSHPSWRRSFSRDTLRGGRELAASPGTTMDIQKAYNAQWFPQGLNLSGGEGSAPSTPEPPKDGLSMQQSEPALQLSPENVPAPEGSPQAPEGSQAPTDDHAAMCGQAGEGAHAAAPGRLGRFARNSLIGLIAGVSLFNALEAYWLHTDPPVQTSSVERVVGGQKIAPLENHASEKDRGLVLLQIDGLSYERLQEAMDKGYAPTMKRMVSTGDYRFGKFFSGIPAETLPILSGAFYGVPIAANDWYDKDKATMVDSIKEEPNFQQEAQAKGEPGLLSDGTSYLSPLTGGSADTAINVSALYQEKDTTGSVKAMTKEVLKDIRLIKHGKNSITKMTYAFARDFFKARSDLKARGQWNTWWDKHYPYLISMADNVFPTVATEGVKSSIDRGLPITYVDYTSYDESGHYYGAKTQKAMESIAVVDKKIGEVLDKIEKEKKPYDLVVFSDHGQTESTQFSSIYGKSVQDMVLDWANDLNPPVPAKKGDIEIAHTYSSAGVYFNFTRGRAGHDDIEKHYPGLTRTMINHPSMDFVAYRTVDGIAIESRDGKITKTQSGIKVEGTDPLEKHGDSTFLTNLIAEYMEVPKTGDMLLFGGYHNGRIIDFNDKYSMVSLHGGLGGEQNDPFMIYGKDVELHPETIKNPMDLYGQLKKVKAER